MKAQRAGPENVGRLPKVKRVIVAGYGPIGRAVTERLRQAGVQVTLVEMNRKTCATQQSQGHHVIEGDVAAPEILREAGVDTADALILTIPNEEAVFRACAEARQLAPKLHISVRVHHPSGAMRAAAAGADHATIEEIVTARAMEAEVVEHLSKPSA